MLYQLQLLKNRNIFFSSSICGPFQIIIGATSMNYTFISGFYTIEFDIRKRMHSDKLPPVIQF